MRSDNAGHYGDDFNDPVADAVRSILDGHIVLTRELAIKGHFPAIDVSASASRVMSDIVSPQHWQQTNYFRELLGTYNSALDMIQIGAYQPGTNPKLDEAIRLMPVMENFLKQGITDQLYRAAEDPVPITEVAGLHETVYTRTEADNQAIQQQATQLRASTTFRVLAVPASFTPSA
ncbi:MAG: hypothetical protein EOO77_44990 [Oxalobacteraceae bacterium]|nr:MAG: hypothetical protein EOO77_44990 [Oxalobacteraceae bacterium]